MVKKNKTINDAHLEDFCKMGNAEYMDEGLVLTDCIADAPIPHEPTRVNFILMALCKQGSAHYSIDTKELDVKPGDLMFISAKHIVDHYTTSPDFECLCIMLTPPILSWFCAERAERIVAITLLHAKPRRVAYPGRDTGV